MKRLVFAASFVLLLCVSMSAQSYVFQTVNYPGDTFTQLLGVNNSLTIAGYHNFNQNSGFTLRLPANFTTENDPGSMMTQVTGINNGRTTDGFYVDNNNVTHGFYDLRRRFSPRSITQAPLSTSYSGRTTWGRRRATTA